MDTLDQDKFLKDVEQELYKEPLSAPYLLYKSILNECFPAVQFLLQTVYFNNFGDHILNAAPLAGYKYIYILGYYGASFEKKDILKRETSSNIIKVLDRAVIYDDIKTFNIYIQCFNLNIKKNMENELTRKSILDLIYKAILNNSTLVLKRILSIFYSDNEKISLGDIKNALNTARVLNRTDIMEVLSPHLG